MPTKPLIEFIPRAIEESSISDLLKHLSSLIDEVVNYGSHIFRWGIDHIKDGDHNMPALLMYRHIFELIDSISILVRNSSVEPANILLRTLFESYMNFEYLFEKDFVSRGMDFLVCSRHKEILSMGRFDPSDEMHARYEAMKAKDKISRDIPTTPVPDIAERIQSTKEVLNLPAYRESRDEYDRIKAASHGKSPKHWYSMHNGPKNACELAEYLGFPAQYDLLYRNWSELVHGTDVLKGKIHSEGPGLVSFLPLRMPSEAPFVTLMAVTFGLSSIRIFTGHYIPDKILENADWYNREIKSHYMHLRDINIIVI